MDNMGKSFASILILIIAVSSLSLIIIKPAYAQTATPTASPIPIPVPSVPVFTVKFVNSSYEVPAGSSINPYTGQKVTTAGYYVENESIELTIKNQPFVSFINNINGIPWNISLFYNVREKGHYAENWTDLYNPEFGYQPQSSSDYTIISYGPLGEFPALNGLSSGGKVDFQVQAIIGSYLFAGSKTGDWSSTQTLTVPAASTSAATSPTPTVLEFPSLSAILIVFIAVSVLITVLATVRKRKKVKSSDAKEVKDK